jgi:hypothetical protein
MRTRTALIAAAAAALLVAACGGDDSSAAKSDTSTSVTAKPFDHTADEITDDTADDGASTVACGSRSTDPDELEALLPTSVPAGFEQQPDDVGDTGPSDLAKAIRDDGEDDARAVLTDAGFLRGYQRLWVDDDDSELIAFIYEFCDDAGAAAYKARDDAFGADGTTAFTPAGVPGASGYSATDESGLRFAQVQVTSGHFLVQGMADGSADLLNDAQVQGLAADLTKALVAEVSAA